MEYLDEEINLDSLLFIDGLYTDVRIENNIKYIKRFREGNSTDENHFVERGAYVRVFDGFEWYDAVTTNLSQINEVIRELATNAYITSNIHSITRKLGFPCNFFNYDNNIKLQNKINNKIKIDNNYQVEFKKHKCTFSNTESTKIFISSERSKIIQKDQWFGIDIDVVVGDYRERISATENTCSKLINQERFAWMDDCKDNIMMAAEDHDVVEWKDNIIFSPKAMGILIHEAVGHISESDLYVSREHMEEYVKNMGEIGNQVNIIDYGGIKRRGHYLYDDEGVQTQKTYILKNGRFNTFLTDMEHSIKWNIPFSGNGRAVSFMHEPIVRMSNTYMLPGTVNLKNLIESLNEGILVTNIGAASSLNGEISLENIRGYIINKGKISKPAFIKSYKIKWYSFLRSIKTITKEFDFYDSNILGCDKENQKGLNVSMGAPYVLMNFK